jgi:hypothetical protein
MSNWHNLFTQRGSDWRLSHSLLNNQITPNAAILEHLPTILHLPGGEGRGEGEPFFQLASFRPGRANTPDQ